MPILLKTGWEKKLKSKVKVYPFKTRDREFVDKTFDELHELGKMSWTTTSTPFSYPCFVVRKNQPNGELEGRIVIDIQGLNNITVPDAYLLPLQSDIIFAVRNCSHITVIDCVFFYYPWRVNSSDRRKFTIIIQWGQECFNVAIIRYKNLPAYIQRQIDRIQKPHRNCTRVYVDDIVIFSRFLEDHLKHLCQIFTPLAQNNISIKSINAFIGYPSVHLLGQKVDSLGLTTAEMKLQAISKLMFFYILRQLEYYLGLTRWFCRYIKGHSKITDILKQLEHYHSLPG